MATKKAIKTVKLEIQAGKATPAPPLGPILGQNSIPIQPFCQEFNDKTRDLGNNVIPVIVHVFEDRSFRLELKQPTIISLLKNKFKIPKGSGEPNKVKVKSVKREDLRDIAEKKLPDLNTKNIESAISIVAGVAASMGIEVQ